MPFGRRHRFRTQSGPLRGAWGGLREELAFMVQGVAAIAAFLFIRRLVAPAETDDPDAPVRPKRRRRERRGR